MEPCKKVESLPEREGRAQRENILHKVALAVFRIQAKQGFAKAEMERLSKMFEESSCDEKKRGRAFGDYEIKSTHVQFNHKS